MEKNESKEMRVGAKIRWFRDMMKIKRWTGIFCLLVILFPSICFGATYYIDYASGLDSNNGTSNGSPWKHHPYMVGWSGSYSHSAGDIFIFKGGETWPYDCFPLTLRAGGSAGSPDQYTVDHTWYSGASWSRPIFNGGQRVGGGTATQGANGRLITDGGTNISNLVFDNLEMQDVGNPSDGSGSAFYLSGSSVEVKNCKINPYCLEGISYGGYSWNTSRVYFHDNIVQNTGRWTVYGAAGYVVDDVKIYNNVWQFPQTTFGGFHLDGVMLGDPIGNSTNATVTNVRFYNNHFWGSVVSAGVTALYYENSWVANALIYNNLFELENTSTPGGGAMSAFIRTGPHHVGYLRIYNNTFSADSFPGYDRIADNAIMIGTNSSSATIEIKNNIISGPGVDINTGTGYSSLVIDYNLHNPSAANGYGYLAIIGTTSYSNLTNFRNAGYETHGIVGDPKFYAIADGTAGSGDWHLQPNSPAIDAGTSLISYFTTDLDGVPRPQGSAWDMGAYEWSINAPQAPQNLRIVQ
jgi:hypothetical protein